MRGKPTKPDRREPATGKSVKQVTAKPKGITPEMREPKRPRTSNNVLGQSGQRKKGHR